MMKILQCFSVFVIVVVLTAAAAEEDSGVATNCGTLEPLSASYLQGVKALSNDGYDRFLFAPTAYFQGEATKLLSSGKERSLFQDFLCVDGATIAEEIFLYDDGTHGDDIAEDGVYSRGCVHFCESVVDFNDYWGFAYEHIYPARLIAVDSNLKGQIPIVTLPTEKQLPGAKVLATSHAIFFADPDTIHMPEWPVKVPYETFHMASGHNIVARTILSIFGDIFDYHSFTAFEFNTPLFGGMAVWQENWDIAGGPNPQQKFGATDPCTIAITGVPVTRLQGVSSSEDVVDNTMIQIHELIHGVSGFTYTPQLAAARNFDGLHSPPTCTIDHSALQSSIIPWTKDGPRIPISYCIGKGDDCQLLDNDKVIFESNEDCEVCPDEQLANCCSFHYEESLGIKEDMVQYPDKHAMSYLFLHIAGFITEEEVPDNKKTYYCLGSDTEEFTVNDTNRSHITSDFVSRFTFDDLIAANGGPRNPPARAEKDLRNAALHIGQRIPNEAEIVFYTQLRRHHEIETEPHDRLPLFDGTRKPPLTTWSYATRGHSSLHSKLHGIPCGGGLQTPSCLADDKTGCESSPCGNGAICIPMDGKPLCLCREGLVGDGTVCVLPSKSASFPPMSAKDLFLSSKNGSIPSILLNGDGIDGPCFGQSASHILSSDLPPYPGGVPPYAATTCGDSICKVGYDCINNECAEPTGISLCEQHDFSESQCNAIGCCRFVNGNCFSAVGSEICPEIEDKGVKSCEDQSTCCVFSCQKLEYYYSEDEGSAMIQVGNYGKDCVFNIEPDVFGIVHSEVHIQEDFYYENGLYYTWDNTAGPLYQNGTSMHQRCFDQCFAPTLSPTKAPVSPTPNPISSTPLPSLRVPTAANIQVSWIVKPSYDDVMASVGDTIQFNWSSSHNVYIHPSRTCDKTDAIEIGNISSTKYTFTEDDVGEVYFTCHITGHCLAGQILKVIVTYPEEAPSSLPIAIPNGGEGGFNICFSGNNIVDVLGKGRTLMSDIQLGDQIKTNVIKNTSEYIYETIYSFGHYNPNQFGEFLQLKTDRKASDNLIEMSKDHLILLATGKFVPAGKLKVGDHLMSTTQDNDGIVSAINIVRRKGVYAPFSMSGTIVVSGIIASSFVTLQGNKDMVTIGSGTLPLLSAHSMAYLFESIHRIAFRLGFSNTESYSSEGVSNWIEIPHIFFFALLNDNRSIVIQLLILLPCVAFLIVAKALEDIYINGIIFLATAVVTTVGLLLLRKKSSKLAIIEGAST